MRWSERTGVLSPMTLIISLYNQSCTSVLSANSASVTPSVIAVVSIKDQEYVFILNTQKHIKITYHVRRRPIKQKVLTLWLQTAYIMNLLTKIKQFPIISSSVIVSLPSVIREFTSLPNTSLILSANSSLSCPSKL